MDSIESKAPQIVRDYTQLRQLCRIATSSETWTIPGEIIEMIEVANESPSYNKCIRYVRGEEDLKDDPEVADVKDMQDIY